MAKTPAGIAKTWLDTLSDAFATVETAKVAECLVQDGWLRDILVFSWARRSIHGRESILSYLSDKLANVSVRNLKLDESLHLKPEFFPAGPDMQGVELVFKFETALFDGVALSRILPVGPGGSWKAAFVTFVAQELKGHEEAGYEKEHWMRRKPTYEENRQAKVTETEADPYVLIVGAGLTGISIAARFRQMNIPTIVIERHPHVGDVWRKRYPTLTLHTPRAHHSLLYEPLPYNWPDFTPRDKLALLTEQYARSQELVAWTSTSLLPTPSYDTQTHRWTATVLREGKEITLKPAHIVIATGLLGKSYIPTIPGLEQFKGEQMHSNDFAGGAHYEGKNVVVVGAGNSSADMCQDLYNNGAASVTMVQRSVTNVISADAVARRFGVAYPEGRPADISDLKAIGTPMGWLKQFLIMDQSKVAEEDKEMREGLKKSGFNRFDGPDGAGQLYQVYVSARGYWIDVGCSELIAAGHVKIKQGSQIDRISENSILFKDGSEIRADSIIWATGFQDFKETLAEIFGKDVIDQTGPVWGFNEEHEVQGTYVPSGYPGLWYAAGDFSYGRFYSKILGLWIKAQQVGILDPPTLQSAPAVNGA